MIEVHLNAEDLDLIKKLNIPELVDDVLKNVMETIRSEIVEYSPIGEKEHTPRFKDQWSVVKYDEGGYSFSNPAPYAHRLEYGTYLGVGPRTGEAAHALTGEAGIFSSQTIRGGVAGIIGLYLSDEEHVKKIADEISKRLVEEFEKRK